MEKRRYLSQTSISTFAGNVLPLRLLGGTEYGNEKIRWTTDHPEIVQITDFSRHYPTGGEFTDGVLLTFLEPGEAAVTARYGKKTYICAVSVREMRNAEPDEKLQYFVGDMHDHTWNNHKLHEFSNRLPEFYPINYYMPQMMADGKMDFAVVSDHADIMSAREFYRGYADADMAGDGVVFFPGAESQVTQKEKDRYGITHMHGGEILIFNADHVSESYSWNSFFKKLKNSPFAFCGYPHPQIVGISVPGVWNFRHMENNDERFQKLFRFVEMGDGAHRSSNVINHYIYSVALDAGLKVSPTCSSDGHGPNRWGYDGFRGKTVIMATEKSKEAFLDAIQNNRMYATSTGNVKVHYTVNGKTAPMTLSNEGTYRFQVELSYFRMGEPDTHIQKCRLITDQGTALVELENMGDSFAFTVTAPDSHYFYLCLMDEKGRKTWSCPVWTGKPFVKKKEKKLTAIAKTGITAYDRVSRKEAPETINDAPMTPWVSEFGEADLIFDLGREATVSALSHYPYWIDREVMQRLGSEHRAVDRFPCEYRIFVSEDGETYAQIASGHFRIFGEEETVRFPTVKTRFIRLQILSSTGKAWGEEETAGSPLTIGEITFWN